MSEISILIVDDEPLARRRLTRQLARIDNVRIIGEAGNAAEAYDLVMTLGPDVLLLDIQMPGESGFDLLDRLNAAMPVVIFATAFDHHAIRAFDASAVDYVTKPIEPVRLEAAIVRAKTAVAAKARDEKVAELHETVAALRHALRAHENRTIEFWVKSKEDYLRILSDQIIRFQAERDYVRIHSGDESYLHHESLASLEQRLDPMQFIRIHRGAIVRRDCIKRLRQAPFASLIAVLADESEIRVGRTYSSKIRALISQKQSWF
ncbi:LytTR family DNA-binding domain-containing protein [Sphingobium sp. BYY-5]|uniref:LytR/AlgR family response regulator transcription factor n=1 Tax=Sphingobium sp. BYY-5 TaxID=2926400 RepID=UPI001FA7E027|nr:LytTR family DNA-binding domain-containing protein [Sphingobium sp. BYY-5]MCI4592109.1 LytTR family DNA-binding domain-containing protein [Sphingobium sp. BYY-5]